MLILIPKYNINTEKAGQMTLSECVVTQNIYYKLKVDLLNFISNIDKNEYYQIYLSNLLRSGKNCQN